MRLLLLDLDGVVRHFDPARQQAIEADHGLEPGRLWATAFEHRRGHAVITGSLSRADWIAQIDAELGTSGAAAAWLSTPAEVDGEMVALTGQLRADGLRVAVLTNATDTIADELARDGLDECFDAVYSSVAMGVAKPDPDVFLRVCAVERVAPGDVLFFDDSRANVGGAEAAGLRAHVFESVAQVVALVASEQSDVNPG